MNWVKKLHKIFYEILKPDLEEDNVFDVYDLGSKIDANKPSLCHFQIVSYRDLETAKP